MLSWQVGRVKITRIVEMDLPVRAKVIPQATAAELRHGRCTSDSRRLLATPQVGSLGWKAGPTRLRVQYTMNSARATKCSRGR